VDEVHLVTKRKWKKDEKRTKARMWFKILQTQDEKQRKETGNEMEAR
jgi:hypothetical protein